MYYRTSISRLFRVLAWMGREHFFMMQYAMLITLHIPKWKNCFKQKKRTKYDTFHRMYIFALYLKIQIKKKSSKYNINICINIRKVFTVLPCYSCRFNRDTGL